MKQQRTNKITVVGAVKTPGVYELPRGSSSLMAALVAAGGLADDAGPEVEIRSTVQHLPRGPVERIANDGPQAELTSYRPAMSLAPVRINLLALEAGPAPAKAHEIHDGDVVQVPKRELPAIHVLGLVNKPGEFPYPPKQQLRLMDAVALAGGTSHNLADKVLVVRQLPGQPEPVHIALSLRDAAKGADNVTLAPGDTVQIEQTPVTLFTDTLRDFFRVGFSAALPGF